MGKSLERAFRAWRGRSDSLQEYEQRVGESTEGRVARLVGRIDSPSLGESMRVYSKIAFGREVPDSKVTWLHRELLNSMRELRSTSEESDEALTTAWRLLENAKTRQDKVIAIDAAMQYFHDAGGIYSLIGFWSDKSDRDWDTMKAILDMLSE